MTLDEVIKQHTLKTLSESESKLEACKRLGISIRTLRNYLHKWNLSNLVCEPFRRDRFYFPNPSFEEREAMQNWNGEWQR